MIDNQRFILTPRKKSKDGATVDIRSQFFQHGTFDLAIVTIFFKKCSKSVRFRDCLLCTALFRVSVIYCFILVGL